MCKRPAWPYNVHAPSSPITPPPLLSFIQCFGKIIYNVAGKEVTETGKALGVGQKSGGPVDDDSANYGDKKEGNCTNLRTKKPDEQKERCLKEAGGHCLKTCKPYCRRGTKCYHPQGDLFVQMSDGESEATNSGGFSPIPPEADFHTLTHQIVSVVDKWTVKRCMGESLHPKSLIKKGLCFLSTVVMKLIRFVFVTLATTIKPDCSASIGLGASLFPTAFTGYGIEFNTISCGLSALEKIGSTFISILQLVFKSKEGAEQGGGGDAEAKKEHMSPKYHESAADIKKRRAESFGGNKGSVMYKMFDGEEGRN